MSGLHIPIYQSLLKEIYLHHNRIRFGIYQLQIWPQTFNYQTKENWYCCKFTYWINYMLIREVLIEKVPFKFHTALYKPFKTGLTHLCSIQKKFWLIKQFCLSISLSNLYFDSWLLQVQTHTFIHTILLLRINIYNN